MKQAKLMNTFLCCNYVLVQTKPAVKSNKLKEMRAKEVCIELRFFLLVRRFLLSIVLGCT